MCSVHSYYIQFLCVSIFLGKYSPTVSHNNINNLTLKRFCCQENVLICSSFVPLDTFVFHLNRQGETSFQVFFLFFVWFAQSVYRFQVNINSISSPQPTFYANCFFSVIVNTLHLDLFN